MGKKQDTPPAELRDFVRDEQEIELSEDELKRVSGGVNADEQDRVVRARIKAQVLGVTGTNLP